MARLFFVLAAILVLTSIWMAAGVVGARGEVLQAKDHITYLKTVENLKPADLADALRSARIHLEAANDKVHDPVWWIASKLPLIGNTADALMKSTEIGVDILADTAQIESQLRALPQTEAAALDPEFLQILGDGADQLSPAVTQAREDLYAIDLAWVPAQLTDPIVELRGQLDVLEPYLSEAQSFAKVAPALLGLEKETRWLVVFANGAEARPSGGFPGGWGIITASKGKLKLSNLESNDRLSRYELQSWQEIAGVDAAELYNNDLSRVLDMGLSPDFRLTGHLLWQLYTDNTPGPKPQGVLQLDEHALAHLLKATGPIEVDGQVLNENTAVQFITRDVYALHPDPKEKDLVALGVAQSIFDRLGSGEVGFVALAKALIPAMKDGRVRAWTVSSVLENNILQTSLSGYVEDTKRFTHAVAVANGGGNKLEAYVQVDAQYLGGQCDMKLPYRNSTMRITVTNGAPKSGLPAYVTPRIDLGIAAPKPQGGTREIIYVHAPLGTELTGATLDGKQIDFLASGMENGRSVWRFDVEIKAQSKRLLLVQLMEPALEEKPYAQLWRQAMTLPMTVSAAAGPRCLF